MTRSLTSTGLYGTITELDDEVAWLELAPGTVVALAPGGPSPAGSSREQADADDARKHPVPTPIPRPAPTAADRAVGPDPTET